MAIAVDSTTTDSEQTAGASPTLTYSTACDVDDILLVAVAVNVSGGSATIGAPSTTSGSTGAWTEVAKINPSNGCGVGVWWAKVTGAGTINVSQTTTRSGNNVGARGVMLEISGANTTTPIGSTDTHDASSDATAANTNLQIAGENGNLVFLVGGNWNASGNNTEDIDSTSDAGYTAIWTGTTRYESGQCDYHAGRTILSADDSTTRGVLDQVSGTGDWVAAIVEVVAAAAGGGDTSLTVADAIHGHTTDGVALTQAHTLAVADGTDGHTTDAPALTQQHSLTVADAADGHAADAPTLTQQHTLVVADGAHGHTVDGPAVTQQHSLVVQDAASGHAADNVVLGSADTLTVADAAHAHASDGVALTQQHVLVVAEAIVAHAADNLALTQAHGLVVADALHAHTAETVVLVGTEPITATATSVSVVSGEPITTEVTATVAERNTSTPAVAALASSTSTVTGG